MEEYLIDWLRQKAGYGKGTAGIFTSGGTQSNLMGRDWCIAKRWKQPDGTLWSVQSLDIPAEAMQKVKVVCSENTHFPYKKRPLSRGLFISARKCGGFYGRF